ncbi:MAG: HAMP domain-containing histidine kinase [Clostridia bacterium]|nr:HAMP domain-containing histidine kinase [Clostridia bacterium]
MKEEKRLTAFREHTLSAEAYLLCTPAGRVRFASSMLKMILGEDLNGRNLNDFLEDALCARLVAETLAGREYAFRCRIREQTFRCTAQPWEDGDGIQIALFPVNPEKTGADGHCANRFMAREINRELGVLLPALQQLEKDSRPGQENYLAMMRLHLYRLLRMSRNLEDLALLEDGQTELCLKQLDMTALVAQLLEKARPFCAVNGIRLTENLPAEPVFCVADEEKVRSMLFHLLSNAVQAQKGGGAVQVSLRGREDGSVTLSVSDRGGGMDAEALQELNGSLERRDPLQAGGLGLGLLLTRAYMQAHGGRMMLMAGDGGMVASITFLPLEAPSAGELHGWCVSYGTGIDPVMVELSCIGTKELYLK